MDDRLRDSSLKRLGTLQGVPTYKALTQRYNLFCSSLQKKEKDFEIEVAQLNQFTDTFFKTQNINDPVLRNKIAFKAFCLACLENKDS